MRKILGNCGCNNWNDDLASAKEQVRLLQLNRMINSKATLSELIAQDQVKKEESIIKEQKDSSKEIFGAAKSPFRQHEQKLLTKMITMPICRQFILIFIFSLFCVHLPGWAQVGQPAGSVEQLQSQI